MLLMLKKAAAEFLGTFLLVLCGTGSVVLNAESGGAIGNTGIAAAFGLAVALVIMLFGSTSGALVNPAVTLVFMAGRKISVVQGLYYIIAQLTGALGASLLLHRLFPQNNLLGVTLPGGSWQVSFALETLLTCLLMFIILRATAIKNVKTYVVAVVIGAVVGLEAFFAGPVCGASMNPARSIGPALVSGHLEYAWLYIIAPCAGALAALALNAVCFKTPYSCQSPS